MRLDLAYDGTGFHGWARQPSLRTVQGVIEEALERVLRMRPALSVAGRTDAGVHARRQVASFVVAARANAFLHQMVRSLVGTLVAVGEGRLEADSMPGVLEARDRAAAGPVAPAHGLTLERVVCGRRRETT